MEDLALNKMSGGGGKEIALEPSSHLQLATLNNLLSHSPSFLTCEMVTLSISFDSCKWQDLEHDSPTYGTLVY